MKQARYVQFAAFAATVAAYLAIRFWNLTASCLWFDEIFSVHAAEHSWNSILNFVALDLIHPPLFYLLLKIWIGIGGEGLLWLRLLPVVISILAVFPFVALTKELKLGVWTRILALLFFATNGSLIKYSQEVRMYCLLMCLSLFSMWLFARYFYRGKNFTALVIINVLMVYTHYFGWFVVLTEVVLVLWFQRIKWRRMAAMFAVVFASFIPWVIAVLQAARHGSDIGQNIGWMKRPEFSEITQFKFNLIEPLYYAASSIDPMSIYQISVPLMVIFTLAFVLYLVNWKRAVGDEQTSVFLLAIFMTLPILLAFAASWLLPYSIWGTRHLIIVFAPFTVIAAIVITSIPVRWLRIVSITLLLLFGCYAIVNKITTPQQLYSWCAWESLTRDALSSDPANIYTTEDLVAYIAWFTARERHASEVKITKITQLDGVEEDTAYFMPRGSNEVEVTDFSKISEKRLWLIFRASGWNEEKPPLRDFLEAGYRIKTQTFIDSRLNLAILVLLEH